MPGAKTSPTDLRAFLRWLGGFLQGSGLCQRHPIVASTHPGSLWGVSEGDVQSVVQTCPDVWGLKGGKEMLCVGWDREALADKSAGKALVCRKA